MKRVHVNDWLRSNGFKMELSGFELAAIAIMNFKPCGKLMDLYEEVGYMYSKSGSAAERCIRNAVFHSSLKGMKVGEVIAMAYYELMEGEN